MIRILQNRQSLSSNIRGTAVGRDEYVRVDESSLRQSGALTRNTAPLIYFAKDFLVRKKLSSTRFVLLGQVTQLGSNLQRARRKSIYRGFDLCPQPRSRRKCVQVAHSEYETRNQLFR